METELTAQMEIANRDVPAGTDRYNFYSDPAEVTIQLFTGSSVLHLHLSSEQADTFARHMITAAGMARIMEEEAADDPVPVA